MTVTSCAVGAMIAMKRELNTGLECSRLRRTARSFGAMPQTVRMLPNHTPPVAKGNGNLAVRPPCQQANSSQIVPRNQAGKGFAVSG